MHHSCVQPDKPGGQLQCPICKVEGQLETANEDGPVELPRWHEAEVGAPVNRKNKVRSKAPVVSPEPDSSDVSSEYPDPSWEKEEFMAWRLKRDQKLYFGTDKPIPHLSPGVGRAVFPLDRWPTDEEARLNGYQTVKDWYICYRNSGAVQTDIGVLSAEFVELSNRLSLIHI